MFGFARKATGLAYLGRVKRVGGHRGNTAGKAIVVIDQRPLRRGVANHCRDLMERLSVVRALWHQFDREDKPAFVRWRAREFGALLSRAREIENQIHDAQTLIHEVEREMRRRFQNPYTAYQRVLFRRENPALAAEEEETDANEKANGEKKTTDFEKEALFQEWVQRFLGTNPDKMDDEAYKKTFEAFKTHMFTAPVEEPAPRRTKQRATQSEPLPVQEEPEGVEESAVVDARVKSLYRKLVRRLHPDHRGNGEAHVSGLWHEVQEAYLAADIARMEILLALSNIDGDAFGDDTTVAEMRSVHTELWRSLRTLEKSVAEGEGEEAWNFARSGPSEELRLRVERELKHELAQRLQRLDLLTRTIAEWAAGPERNPKIQVVRYFR